LFYKIKRTPRGQADAVIDHQIETKT